MSIKMQVRFPVWFSKASAQVRCLAPIDLNPCYALSENTSICLSLSSSAQITLEIFLPLTPLPVVYFTELEFNILQKDETFLCTL